MPSPEPPAGGRGVDYVLADLRGVGYLADRAAATVVHLSGVLQKPVLVEGPAGTGKTALATSVAGATGRPYPAAGLPGPGRVQAIDEWDYGASCSSCSSSRATARPPDRVGDLRRGVPAGPPLLAAIRSPEPVVLLIDEVDRLDIESEALLLEVLSEFQVSVPELGTVTDGTSRRFSSPRTTPVTCPRRSSGAACTCTSGTRPPSARRRSSSCACPSCRHLAAQIAQLVAVLRGTDLRKPPSVAESIDWARTRSPWARPS